MAREPKKPGPDPDRLKIEGDWEDAMGRALDKPRPPEGWPDGGEDEDSDGKSKPTPEPEGPPTT